jgi:hypothetical protein
MLRRKDAPMVGIAMRDAADGETVEVQTIGTDVVEDQKLVQESVADAFAEAVKAGIRPPGPLAVAEVQVFYEGGRPVEVRVAGKIAKVDQRIDDRPSVYVFAPWSSNPAPRWAEDGDLLPEDAARSHLVVKSTSAMLDGELKPILRRSWNFVEHTNLWVTPWRNFRDLAEAEAEQPEDLQAVAHLVLDRQQDEGAAYALTHAGAPFRDRLVRELKKRLRDLWQRIGMDDAPVSDEAGATVNEGAAKWLAEKFPTGGAESAEELRRRAEGAPWTPWWPEDGEDFAFLLRRLVTLTWCNGLEAEAERDRTAPSVIEAASASIGGYGGIPRIAAPMSWAFGGPAISAATVNGDSYALEPEAAASALVPRSFMLTGSMKQPERFNMPLELDPPMPLAIQVTDATGYALTPHAGKLALIVMAHDRAMGGKVYRWSLDGLVKSLNPGSKRIQASHYRPVADGLEQLSKLHAFLPNGQKYRVFYATGLLTDTSTAHAMKDAEVVLGIDPVFSALTREWGGARGYFLINLDGAMRLDNREPIALRTYVRVAALWNTAFKPGGEPDPGRMKPTRIDEIGLMANNYRHGTVDLLRAQGEKAQAKRARMALSEDREKTRDTLQKLADEGLLTLKETDATGARVGKHEFVILPPDEYVEAWRRHRNPRG